MQSAAAERESRTKQGWIARLRERLAYSTSNPADLDRAIVKYETGMKLDLNDYYPSANLQEVAHQVVTDGPVHWEFGSTLDDCRTAAMLWEDPRRIELLNVVNQLEGALTPKPATLNPSG